MAVVSWKDLYLFELNSSLDSGKPPWWTIGMFKYIHRTFPKVLLIHKNEVAGSYAESKLETVE